MFKYLKSFIWRQEKESRDYKVINPSCLNNYVAHFCNNPYGSDCEVNETDKHYNFMQHLTEEEKRENLNYWKKQYNIKK